MEIANLISLVMDGIPVRNGGKQWKLLSSSSTREYLLRHGNCKHGSNSPYLQSCICNQQPIFKICNLVWLDGIFYLIIGGMLCPFSISKMLGPFFIIVNLPVRDLIIVCMLFLTSNPKCKASGL
jgi:hypothetical protein